MTGTRPLRALDDATTPAPGELRSSFLQLTERFRPHEADGLSARWVVDIDGDGAYTVHIHNGGCFVSVGAHADPDTIMRTDRQTWLKLVSGEQDGVAAFTQDHLTVHGDLNLALRLESLFQPGPDTQRVVRTARTNAAGVDLESLIIGRGTPVVLLHGLGANKVSFVPTLDALASRYEVHALDLPGFGKSGKPLPAARRYSMRWMADVVHGYLRAQGIGHCYVVGNSMGGRIAVELGLRHPRRLGGVVGLCPAVAFDEYQWLAPMLRVLHGHWVGLAPIPFRRETVEAAIRGMFHDPYCLRADNITAAAEEFVRNLSDRRHRLAILACLRHLAAERASGRRSFWTSIERLRVPSYWVFGTGDPLVSAAYCERVRESLPDARCEVWEDVGHVPQFEVPQRTNQRVGAFIDELDAARHR
ncbi:MAG: alpha/beta fold hydrolase [Actinobacteria bacterium]|nr:alpha/beta fold hydrolase [Actinomycetota bacterium]